MGSSREVCIDATIYRGPDDETEIEVEVSGTAVPYWPGNRDNPPEGGEVEDIEAKLWIGRRYYVVPLTEAERATFEEQLRERAAEDERDDYEEIDE